VVHISNLEDANGLWWKGLVEKISFNPRVKQEWTAGLFFWHIQYFGIVRMITGLCNMLLQHCSHQRFMSVHWNDYWVVIILETLKVEISDNKIFTVNKVINYPDKRFA